MNYPPPAINSSNKPSSPVAGHRAMNVNLNLDNDPRNRPNPARTPSPTPSELKELKSGAIDWKSMLNWRFWFRKEWTVYYIIVTVIIVLTALMTIYHEQIVHWLEPATRWLHDLSWGWVVPILVLFVISFPPLFGHEIVAVLCGLVWGLWIGFGIVAAGTFLGEVGNFYAFRYCCTARGEKLEKTKISYACLAKVVRDGGFRIALIVRLSAIPGHFTTAVFSTCGMNIFIFSLAAVLSMPKQLITVYLGVILEGEQSQDNKSKIISRVVLTITILITIGAGWYILREMNKVKPEVIYQRRKARQAKLARAPSVYRNDSTDSQVFNANGSDTNIPLTAKVNRDYTAVHAPQPKPGYPRNNAYGYSKSDEDLESQEGSMETSETMYNQYPETRQSVDVPWETGGYTSQTLNQRRPTFPPPGISASPVPEGQQWSQPRTQSPVLPASHLQFSSQQAQIRNSPSPFAAGNSPYSTPPQHSYEPTAMSYHTAMGSDSTYDGYYSSDQKHGHQHAGNRSDASGMSEVNLPGELSRQPQKSPSPLSYPAGLR